MENSQSTRELICLHCSEPIQVDRFFNALPNVENTLIENHCCPYCGCDLLGYLMYLREYEYWYVNCFLKEQEKEKKEKPDIDINLPLGC